PADNVAPEAGIGGDAVHEQRHGAGSRGADVDVADLAGTGRDAVPVGVELGELHYDHLPDERGSLIRPTVGLWKQTDSRFVNRLAACGIQGQGGERRWTDRTRTSPAVRRRGAS